MKEELASDVSKVAHDGSLTERRESAFSEQERQQAREFRAKALKDGCVYIKLIVQLLSFLTHSVPAADLGAIARTSAAVSTSSSRKLSTVTITTDAQVCYYYLLDA